MSAEPVSIQISLSRLDVPRANDEMLHLSAPHVENHFNMYVRARGATGGAAALESFGAALKRAKNSEQVGNTPLSSDVMREHEATVRGRAKKRSLGGGGFKATSTLGKAPAASRMPAK